MTVKAAYNYRISQKAKDFHELAIVEGRLQ
jgi:hypothetical protein